MLGWAKRFFMWILRIPPDIDEVFIKIEKSKSQEKLEEFERWAFGDIDTHTWAEWEREQIWNVRHGDVYTIPDGEYFQRHMHKIIKLYDEYRVLAGL